MSLYRLTGITDVLYGTTLRDVTYGWTLRDNLSSITDNLDSLNNESFGYSARERLASAVGPYGDFVYTYDGVGNRTSLTKTVGALPAVLDTYTYALTDHRLMSVSGGTARSFTHDAAGNVTYDNRTGAGYGYTYNDAGRMTSFSIDGVVQASYTYSAEGQQVIRDLVQAGQRVYNVFGADGNRIAEFLYDPLTLSSSLMREYIWMNGRAVALIEAGQVYMIRTDHIDLPVFATDMLGSVVWEASYEPFGGVHVSAGTPIALRFPGEWFQTESGLHQNWMRDYDPTTGRYVQADPLGLVDGASVYGYSLQNPGRYIDPRGEFSTEPWRPGLKHKVPDLRPQLGGGAVGGARMGPTLGGSLLVLQVF